MVILAVKSFRSFIIFILLVSLQTISGQEESDSLKTYKIEFIDGSVLIGYIISENEDSLQFKTLSNLELTFQKDKISSRTILPGKVIKGELWSEDPNKSRLLFAPTGRSLKQGKGYFAVYEIFFPFIAIGVTDYLIIAGGFSLFPGANNQIIYLAPKVIPYETDNFSVAGGVLILKIPDESKMAGIVYGVSTFDFEKNALTLGLGYGFSGGDFTNNPIIVLGFESRLSRAIKLISENWIIVGNEENMFSFAIRFFGKNLAADFGLVFPTSTGSDSIPFVPWLGFAYNF